MRTLGAIVLTIALASGDLAAARKLFDEGIKREEAGDWPTALAKFREVAAIRLNHIVRFHIALCLEKTGKLVDALSEFSLAKVQAEKEGGTDAELTIANATKHIDVLRARVPSVRVERPTVVAVVTIDGAPALFDSATLLDPGAHVIEVRAETYKPFMKRVLLVDGVRESMVIAPVLEPIAIAKPPPPVVVDAPPNRTATYVLSGIGIASVAAAGVFYGLRAATLSELDGTCVDRADCDPSKRALDDRGRRYTLAGNVLLGVGVACVATAVVLIVLEPRRKTTVAVGAGTITLSAVF